MFNQCKLSFYVQNYYQIDALCSAVNHVGFYAASEDYSELI